MTPAHTSSSDLLEPWYMYKEGPRQCEGSFLLACLVMSNWRDPLSLLQ